MAPASTGSSTVAPFAPGAARKNDAEFGPMRTPATPQQLSQKLFTGEKTVTMFFPQPVLLTLSRPAHKRVSFPVGVQEVPESLADHPYLLAHGAQRHTAAKPKVEEVKAGKETNPQK